MSGSFYLYKNILVKSKNTTTVNSAASALIPVLSFYSWTEQRIQCMLILGKCLPLANRTVHLAHSTHQCCSVLQKPSASKQRLFILNNNKVLHRPKASFSYVYIHFQPCKAVFQPMSSWILSSQRSPQKNHRCTTATALVLILMASFNFNAIICASLFFFRWGIAAGISVDPLQ